MTRLMMDVPSMFAVGRLGVVLVCAVVALTASPANGEDKFLSGPAAAEGIRGSWGGKVKNVDLGGGVALEEMNVDVSANPWRAKTLMKTRLVNKSNIQVLIAVDQRNGTAGDSEVRFAKVPWVRTVPATGQKDQIEGNTLVLRMLENRRLFFQFEGSDGFTIRLERRSDRQAPR